MPLELHRGPTAGKARLAQDAHLVGDQLFPGFGNGLAGQGTRLERELAADVECFQILAVITADRILDRPGDRAR